MREICMLRSTWRGMETSYGSVSEALPGNGEQRIDRTYGYGAIPRPYQVGKRSIDEHGLDPGRGSARADSVGSLIWKTNVGYDVGATEELCVRCDRGWQGEVKRCAAS